MKSLRESGLEEEAGGVEKNPGARGGGESAEVEDTKWAEGGWQIRGLKVRVGWECSISRGAARLNSGGIQAGGVRGGSHSVVSRRSRDAAGGGAAPKVRAAKSSEFREG